MNRLYIVSLVGAVILAGCAVAEDSVPTLLSPTGTPEALLSPTGTPEPLLSPTSTPEAINVSREVISLSISLFLLVDDKEAPDPEISTHRTEADLRKILEGMNDIWSQAGIRLELQSIEFVEVPAAILQGMLAGNLEPFFREIGDGISLPQPSILNGLFIRRIG